MKAGDAITIPPGPLYPHHLLNTSDAELKVLSISTQIKPEIWEYPDSAKSMAWGPGVKLVQRVGEAVEYSEGEPLGAVDRCGPQCSAGGGRMRRVFCAANAKERGRRII